MKIGFQTIVWWPFRDPLEYRLEVIAAAGYQGVEFKERPDELPPIKKLLKLLKKNNLELIGLAGGSLKSRMEYCGEFRPEYLYIEDWNKDIAAKAMPEGKKPYTLAIHPHVFKPTHSLKRAFELLEEDKNLKFVFDTAHLTIAGYEIVEALKRFDGKIDRLAAVHLKDWTEEFGRSVHRYARGFTELGKGIIDLDGVLHTLVDFGYKGWVLVEQDHTKTDPAISTLNCAKWLLDEVRKLHKEQKIIWQKCAYKKQELKKNTDKIVIIFPTELPDTPQEKPIIKKQLHTTKYFRKKSEESMVFLQNVVSAGWRDIDACYDSIAEAFGKLLLPNLVTLWTCSPAHNLLVPVVIKPSIDIPIRSAVDSRKALTGETIEEQMIRHFDLKDPRIRKRFGWPELLDAVKANWMTSIPIFNPWNPNHVRLVVNIFHDKKEVTKKKISSSLEELSVTIGYSMSYALDEVGSTLAAKVNTLAAESNNVKDFAAKLAELIQDDLQCGEAAIYLRKQSDKDVGPVICTEGAYLSMQISQWYNDRRSKLSNILTNETSFIMPRHWWEVAERDSDREVDKISAFASAPFVGGNEAFLGFVCCTIKQAPVSLGVKGASSFSDDDHVVLEAIVQPAVPHLETLKAREDLQEALNREKDALERMHLSLLVLGHETDQLDYGLEQLRKRYLCDEVRLRKLLMHGTERVCQHILGYFKQLDFLFAQTRMLVEELPEPEKELFWSHEELLHKWAIIYSQDARHRKLEFSIPTTSKKDEAWKKDETRPQVYGDKKLLEQIVYNLLRNAIKYSLQGTKILLDCKKYELKKESPHFLTVTNYGRSVDCENPYALDKRGNNVEGIPGTGVGLYNAKRIAEAQGGSIRFECNHVSDYNVPLIEWYLSSEFKDKDKELTGSLNIERERLRHLKKYKEIIARIREWDERSKKWIEGLPLYVPVEDELVLLINKPTYEVIFEVTIPAKGTRR